MVDGVATLAASYYGMAQAGFWAHERGINSLDTGAPWYDTYETSDGRHVAIGPLERHFCKDLLLRLGIDGASLPDQRDRNGWPVLRSRFEQAFKARTRDEWCAIFDGSDACFPPVLDFDQAMVDTQAVDRDAFVEIEGVRQPAPVSRLPRTPGAFSAAYRSVGKGAH